MQGCLDPQQELFCTIDLEGFIPADHCQQWVWLSHCRLYLFQLSTNFAGSLGTLIANYSLCSEFGNSQVFLN